jgi:hypothetical protein
MQLLVATSQTQGMRDNDYYFATEGELVWTGALVCATDQNDPDGGCGCGRGFAGLSSHRACSTAAVRQLGLTRADVDLALRGHLESAGWLQYMSAADAEDMVREEVDEMLRLGAAFPLGTVIERRLDVFRQRLPSSSRGDVS